MIMRQTKALIRIAIIINIYPLLNNEGFVIFWHYEGWLSGFGLIALQMRSFNCKGVKNYKGNCLEFSVIEGKEFGG